MTVFTKDSGRRWKEAALAIGVFAANLLLDRLTKRLALRFLAGREPVSFLGGTVVLCLTGNTGAFLSLGAAWPEPVKYLVLLCLPLLFCVGAMFWLVFRERNLSRIVIVASIAGGGLGNLVDRLFNGFRVIDFLNFGIGPLRTGILNVADLSVTLGALCLLAQGLMQRRREGGEEQGDVAKS